MIACPYSDHEAHFLEITLPDVIPLGPGHWKLNASILDDPAYKDIVHNFWKGWQNKRSQYKSPLNWWDIGKTKIRDLTIKYCSEKAKSVKQDRANLMSSIDRLKSELDRGRVSVLPEYQLALQNLKQFDEAEVKAQQIRSRARWVEEGESSSKYFFNLEKRHGQDKYISAISSGDKVLTDISDILDDWVNFYTDLFKADPDIDTDLQDELLTNIKETLDNDSAQSCEGPVTPGECFEALKGMCSNKSPGSDGLTK